MVAASSLRRLLPQGDGGSDRGDGGGDGHKCLDTGYVLKVEPPGMHVE